MDTPLVFIKPSMDHIDEIASFRCEMLESGGPFHGVNGLQVYENLCEWIEYCQRLEDPENLPPDRVLAEQFMLVREGERRILGMANVRHELNDYLREYSGHIGYGVRTSERNQGYAKAMLSMCLARCAELGIDQVLVTCTTNNDYSRKTILAHGGVFERTAREGEKVTERYWITVS
ncbi:MAG: GNAT family N-acetyltransferase [Propionibacteriaceae bacterium]|nr:GNAT family N-acetyltransferase [Propionibacteriaceae bacterium]